MSSEMIEWIAITLYGADGFALAMWPPAEAWLRDRENVRERYRAKARLVVAAMREPTEAMIAAAWVGTDDVETWQFLIDEALNP